LIKDIKKAEPQFKMNELCRVLDVSLSSYYYLPVKASVATTNVVTLINNISIDSGNTYGKRHIQQS